VLALQSAALSEDVLLCDNEAVLCVSKKWLGQGGRATLATAPYADMILRDIVCLLRQRELPPHANIFVIGTAVINTHNKRCDGWTYRMTF
jgi:hypothetical protein